MTQRTSLAPLLAAAILAIAPAGAQAVDTDPTPPARSAAPSSDYATGKKAIEERDWSGAIKSLSSAAQRDSSNADIHNLLGYAYRNSGQLDPAFKHYQRALQLDPRHLGAHEYIGEAYLMVNNPAKAEEHLTALRRHCPAGTCEPYDDLRKKLEAYRARAR